MQRYLTIIITTIFTVAVIGIFYIKSAFAVGGFPALTLEKLSGDEALTDGLVLTGDLLKEDQSETFRIVGNEVSYSSEASFIEKAIGFVEPKFETLISEHRSFMRGKNYSQDNYYEDESKLVYADVEWERNQASLIKLDVLDKETNQTNSLQQEVPNSDRYNYSYVVDVQVNENEQVQVIVQNYLYNQKNASEEYRVYTIDFEKKELIGNDQITSVPMPEGMGWTDSRIINKMEYLGKEKYLLIKRLAVEESGEFDEDKGRSVGEPTVLVDDYVIYNMETKKAEVLTIPEELYENVTVSLEHIYQSKIYFSSLSANAVEVLPYDIESKSFGEPIGIVLNGGQEIQAISFYKDRIYMVTDDNEAGITIANIDTGKSLYKGVIKDTDQLDNDSEYEINIHNLSVNE